MYEQAHKALAEAKNAWYLFLNTLNQITPGERHLDTGESTVTLSTSSEQSDSNRPSGKRRRSSAPGRPSTRPDSPKRPRPSTAMSMRRNSVSIRETVSFLTKRESPQLFAHRDEETYQPDSEYAKANTVLLPGTYSASSRNSEHINTSGWKMNPKQFYVQEPPAENQATSSWTSKIPLVSDTVSSKGDKRKDSAVVV